MNENALPRLQPGNAMDQLLRGDIVQDKAHRLGRVEASGHARKLVGRHAKILRVATEHGEGGHGIAEHKADQLGEPSFCTYII